MILGGLGACSPRKFLEIRCSEIASQAILGQKHSHTSYLTRGVLHPIFSCPCMHFTKPADWAYGKAGNGNETETGNGN